MPTLPFPDHVRELLTAANPAVVATLRSDGAPVTVATWYLLEDDDRVLVNMDDTRVRLGHLRRDPRLSLTVLAADDWYTHVSLVGRVVELRPDEGLRRHRPAQQPLRRPRLPQPREPAHQRVDGRREVARLGRHPHLSRPR